MISPDSQLDILGGIADRGETVVGVYHSHAGEPTPSEADFETAMNWPGLIWVILGSVECPNNCLNGHEAEPGPTGEPISKGPCMICEGDGTVPDFWIGSLP